MEDYSMKNRPAGGLGPKKPWSKPTIEYDGELRDFVQGSNKPTTVAGEPGDPGHKPQSQ